jgi:DNA-directed RNA polymerase specialized sigma24 family protein
MMVTADDDIRALRRSIAEPAAFRGVFERHHPALRRYLHHRAGDAGVAEELAAETFARAFAARERFADHGHGVRAWLFAIATNLLRDELQARGRRRRLSERLRGEPAGTVAPPVPGDPELAAALAGLRRDELEVLLLHAWGELSYDEIAAALALPVGTVRSRLHRARARLRAELSVPALERTPT